MKYKVLIMYAALLDIPPRDGGDRVTGVSVEYFFFGDNGEQLVPKIYADDVSGTRRGKSFISDPALISKISYVPGIYEGTFAMNIGADGKAVLKLVDFDFLSKASITAVEEKPSK